MDVRVWLNWMKRFNFRQDTSWRMPTRMRQCKVVGADFEGSLAQQGNKVLLHNKLALKKRVYEAADWDSFRNAVNAHKAYGEYLVIKK